MTYPPEPPRHLPSALPAITVEMEGVVGAATLAKAWHEAVVVLVPIQLGA